MSLISFVKSLFQTKPVEKSTPAPDLDDQGFPTVTPPLQPPPPSMPTSRLPKDKRPDPQPGQKWILDSDDGSPWSNPPSNIVSVILEVKQGWVRYRVADNSFMQDEHQTVDIFKLCHYPAEAKETI